MTRPGSMLLALLALLAALVLAAGCGDDDDDDAGGGGGGEVPTIQEGTLTVGSDIPYAPFEFGDPPDYEGFDVDLVNEIATRLDLEVKFQKTPFDTIFRDLAQGKFDMVASSTTITEERKRTVDFSDPYFVANQSLMVKKGSDIQTVDDLDGKTVGAQIGTTGADYAKEETDAEEVRTFDLIDDAFQALASGQVDAVINDFAVSKFAERSKENLEVIQTLETGEEYGFAFAKDSTELRQAVNPALREIKEDGTYTRIYRKWFEEEPPPETFGPGGSPEGG